MHTYLLVVLAFVSCLISACEQQEKYFNCKGTSGVGRYQEKSSFPESPTLHIQGQHFTIDASQTFSGAYEICDESDTVVFLVSTGGRANCDIGLVDLKGLVKNGSFNKISGRLEFAAAGLITGEYQCKAAAKIL